MSEASSGKLPSYPQEAVNSIYNMGFVHGKKEGYTEGYAAAVMYFTSVMEYANSTLRTLKNDTSKELPIGADVRAANPGNPLTEHHFKYLGVTTQARGLRRIETVGDIPNVEDLQQLDGVRSSTVANIRWALTKVGLVLPESSYKKDGMDN